jgi:hypothetical protein
MKRLCIVGGLSTLLVAIIQPSASAGGGIWRVKIEAMEFHSPTSATIVVKPMNDTSSRFYTTNNSYADCSRALIDLKYRPEFFLLKTWSKHVSSEHHQKALLQIKAEAEQKSVIRLAVMGDVFGQRQPVQESWLSQVWSAFLQMFGQTASPQRSEFGIPLQCQFETRGIEESQEKGKERTFYSYSEGSM